MARIDEVYGKPSRPERIIQFGSGAFLRGFFDWMLQKTNEAGLMNASAVIVQSTEGGGADRLNGQNCLYTQVLRGAEGEVRTVVDSISRCLRARQDFEAFMALADQPEMRFIVSNTTEAGICDAPGERLTDTPCASFPGKLTQLLYRRYQRKLPGFIILPCELIVNNGGILKSIVLKKAREWNLEPGFAKFVEAENHFLNTLVDRITPGYPRDIPVEMDYEDALVNTSEFYHFFAIEGGSTLAEELPFHKAGLNVLWTDDLTPYHTRKVRILNGVHTATVGYALLKGFDTVGEALKNDPMRNFMRAAAFDEIVPVLDLPQAEAREYAENVFARFANPYIRHAWRSISLNSVSKFRVRLVPTLLAYREKNGVWPRHLVYSMACLIRLYRAMDVNDAPENLTQLRHRTLPEIMANAEMWGADLSEMTAEVAEAMEREDFE